ncbi:hypothetical protein Tco_0580195 [Tanacetum coccineum]
MLNNLSRCAFNAPGLIIPLRPYLGVLQIGIRAKVIENQGADEELSDGGSPRVIVYGHDGLPMQPVAPPSPDYVPGSEHPPSLDYVPGYVADSDPDKDPEEDPEEDHAEYPADGGDGDDEPSDDDDDDDDTDDEDKEPFEDEDDEREEESHLSFGPQHSSVYFYI